MPVRFPLLLSAALSAAPLLAQLGAPTPNPAFPGGSHRLDVTNALLNNPGVFYDAILGVARDAAGHYFVSARRPNPGASHVLIELDASGNHVGTVPVPAAVDAASLWGLRDLAYDGQGIVYGGSEADSIVAFDTAQRRFDPTRAIPLPAGLTFSTVRAMTFDPTGDQGRGSLWIASWDSEHVELSRTGTILRRHPNVQAQAYGAAFDPVRGTVWWFGQADSGHPFDYALVATEMDPATGRATGQRTFGDPTIFGLAFGGHAGGAEFSSRNGRPTLLFVSQGNSDWIVEIEGRFAFGTSTAGEIGFDGGAAFVGSSGFTVKLDRVSRPFAAALVGMAEGALPLPGGVFRPGSTLWLDTTIPLLASPFLPAAGGTVRLPLPIPNDPNLAGLDLWFQFAVPAPGGNGLPIGMSDGGRIHIHS